MPLAPVPTHPPVTGPGAGRVRGTVVTLAVGKPPRPGTLVAEVARILRQQGVAVDVVLPHEDQAALEALAVAGAARRPHLLLDRGLRPDALAAVAALQASGVPCCNDPGGTALLGDRHRTNARLAAGDVPVPRARRAEEWSQVLAGPDGGARVVKRADDAAGRASGVALLDVRAAEPPFPGPWLVQELVEGDGVDRKLYVVGDRVSGLLKPGPLLGVRAPVSAFDPDARLHDLARRVGAVLDLHLYGVDVVVGPDGPVVVDVNAAPGYRGVAGAPEQVAEHVLQEHLLREHLLR
ncbi:hypothetical protein [Jannaschia sp. R86511]|uniref:hypothetical protein n=1 Tax=Jannaschia sp. R86511 TaxID=3093853 RepID=UPI0036D316F9